MPDPLVSHVVGTTALIAAAFLVIASAAAVQQALYVQTVNLMLSEVAESCARELVELVSLHTLGGGEYTYMLLTLPPSLGGQPYNITLESTGENVMVVRAQLQLHRQVRVVVTPNFGPAPVYAVTGVVKFGELTVAPYLLLPTPPGQRAALVAVRSGGAILVGFTVQPPDSAALRRPAQFVIISWNATVEGLAGSSQRLIFTVWNRGGSAGTARLKVYDDAGRLVGEAELSVEGGGVASTSRVVTINPVPGTYVWTAVCEGPEGSPHDEKSLVVVARQPRITIGSCDCSLAGPPGATLKLNLTLTNVGDYPGSAQVRLNDEPRASLELQRGESRNVTLDVTLPREGGSNVWTLAVRTEGTSYEERRQVFVHVRGGEAPRIVWVNSTIEGVVGWQAKLSVKISNPGASDAEVELRVNGTRVGSARVPARGEAWVNSTHPLPRSRGLYAWNVSLTRDGALADFRVVALIVKDLQGPTRTAILLERFSSMPGGWSAAGGKWDVKDGVLEGREAGQRGQQDGFCSSGQQGRCAVVFYNTSDLGSRLSAGGLSILAKLYVGHDDKDVYRGFALLRGDLGSLYAVSVYLAGGSEGSPRAELLLELFGGGSWSTLDRSASVQVGGKRWYTLILIASYREGGLTFNYSLYDDSTRLLVAKSSRATHFVPARFGFLVTRKEGWFDDLIVSTGDPRYVIIQGLPAGWSVELLDAGGGLVRRATANGTGRVALLVVHRPIVEGATIRLIDPRGSIALERGYPLVVGGDTFVLTSGKD